MRNYRKLSFGLTMAMAISSSAMIVSNAEGYTSHLTNPATFETMTEALQNAGAAVQPIYASAETVFATHPAMADYPEGTTFVYRTANYFGSNRAAGKLNTNLFVFAEQHFDTKEAAKAYLDELGLPELVDSVTGSIFLITPSNMETGFTSSDAALFGKLHTAMMAQKATGMVDGAQVNYPEGEYFGGYGYQYIVAMDGAATFVNNHIATDVDQVGKIAGMLLVGGDMQDFRQIATPVPVYLVNPASEVQQKYMDINQVNANSYRREDITYFNQEKPVMQVKIGKELTAAQACHEAFTTMFNKVMRISATGGDAPYSLTKRAAVVNEMTDLGVSVKFHQDNRFEDIKTEKGDYLEAWYECLPQEVLDGTAAVHSVPLILAFHGMGDDPLMFIDGNGFVQLAGEERVAVVAPEHQDIFWVFENGESREGIELEVMPKLVQYMLDTYPALDPERVYVTGYSMGGWATGKAIHAMPEMFAAAVPMSGICYTASPEQEAQFEDLDMPVMITTSTTDMGMLFDPTAGHIMENHQNLLTMFLKYNEMDNMTEFDFEKYPMCGFPSDSGLNVTLNGEFINHRWFMHNEEGVPMVGLSITDGPTHALYPEFAHLMWDYVSHFSRDSETKAVEYKP